MYDKQLHERLREQLLKDLSHDEKIRLKKILMEQGRDNTWVKIRRTKNGI